MASEPYKSLLEHEKFDSLLLSHTIAQLASLPSPYVPSPGSPADILMSLLPHLTGMPTPTICSIQPAPTQTFVEKLYSRFGNNNFVIHSHLSSIGHGVFPLASRLFNHSCMPNAVVKYIFNQGKSVTMEVVALRDIVSGEEVCCFLSVLFDQIIVNR